MNKEKQRIAIAEWDRWSCIKEIWVDCDSGTGSYLGGIRDTKECIKHKIYEPIPDYLNDINAMHSALESQSIEFRTEFHSRLCSEGQIIPDIPKRRWAEIFLEVALILSRVDE